MRQFFTPVNAPEWLKSVLSSVRGALSDIWPSPLRLNDYTTTGLPPAATWKQGLAYDSTTGAPKYSNGVNWLAIGGSGTTPTGTGFTHITAGVQDAAAKLVDTADINDAQVTLAKQANLAANSVIGNNTAAPAVPLALTQVQLTAMVNAATGALPGAMSAQDKTRLDASFTRYHSLLDCSGSHIAGRVAGTYGMGQGDPLAISGTGTLYPLNTIYIAAADYPAAGTLAAKLRIRAVLYVNDVAPTGNFTIALCPITRPATSGGAGLNIFTIGAAVAGSAATTIAAPAADSSNVTVGADFALPADGHYIIGVVTTATVAVSSHLHLSALLQMRYA